MGFGMPKPLAPNTVTLRSNQVSDSSGNYVPRRDLGNFQVNLIPPTAKLIGTNPVTLGSPNYPFTVVYSDDTAVQRSTLNSQDIRVTGPNNFSQFATLISVSSTQDGSPSPQPTTSLHRVESGTLPIQARIPLRYNPIKLVISMAMSFPQVSSEP